LLAAVDHGGPVAYFTAMALLTIINLPDPLLRQISSPVERFDDELRTLVANMFETMYDAMINPEILHLSDALNVHEEGCLSVPDTRLDIERPALVRVRYQDQHGQSQELEATGLLATAIQHEVDHLEGRLIVDFMSKLRRDMVIRKLKKLAKSNAPLPPRKPEPKKLG
jgi:peptide deformylase